MRLIHVAAVLSVLCAFAGMAATTAGKATSAPHKASSSTTKTTSIKKKAVAKTTSATKPVTASSAKGKPPAKGKRTSAPVATWRSRQQNPTSDRYKEIQQALVDKGYLKNEPNGVWDADSTSALQRFQLDQKMTPTGKINAPSLIGLGLGAKSAGAPEAPALPGAPPANSPPTQPPTTPAPQ